MATDAILAAGYNFSLLLRWLAEFLRALIAARSAAEASLILRPEQDECRM